MKIKKLLILGVIGFAGITFVGSKYFSYAKHEVTSWLDKNTNSPEREIARLRDEVKKLDKAEVQIKDELANEMVMCEKVTKQVAEIRTKVNVERKDVLALADELRASPVKISVGKSVLSLDDAKRKLKSDATVVVQREKTLASLETGLVHREEAKALLGQQLTELQTMKLDLTNQLDSIEVEYKALKLQAMQNKHYRDDSKWSEVRDGIEKLKEKLQVKKIRVGLDTGAGKTSGPVTESVDDIIAPLTGAKSEKSGD